jgi:hypothetical protein
MGNLMLDVDFATGWFSTSTTASIQQKAGCWDRRCSREGNDDKGAGIVGEVTYLLG